jgi:hypothetical protein
MRPHETNDFSESGSANRQPSQAREAIVQIEASDFTRWYQELLTNNSTSINVDPMLLNNPLIGEA